MKYLFRHIMVLISVVILSGCGCMLEEGDSMAVKDYWDGCWAEAKGN